MVGVPAALISITLLGTTTGVYVLDIIDHFINRFGILLVALVAMVAVAWAVRRVPSLAAHMSRYGSVKLGRWWVVLVTAVTPALIALMLVLEVVTAVSEPYGGYPAWMLAVFGWGTAFAALLAGILLSIPKWKPATPLEAPDHDEEVIR